MEATLYAVYDPERKKFLRDTPAKCCCDEGMTEFVDLHEGITLEDEYTANELKDNMTCYGKLIVVPVVLTTPTLP